jgi:hypothetical protein
MDEEQLCYFEHANSFCALLYLVVFDKLFISALAPFFFFFPLFISPIFLRICCFTLLFFHVVWPYASLGIPSTWAAKFLPLVFVA